LALYDPLPPSLNYVDDSLRYPFGAGEYEAATRAIRWAGVVPPGHLNSALPNFLWGDSDGQGELPRVRFEWEELGSAGMVLPPDVAGRVDEWID